MSKPDIQQALEKMNVRLRQLEAPYINQKKYLESKDWQDKRDRVLLKLSTCLGSYTKGQDAVNAVFVVAQAKEIMLEVQEASDIVVEYEDIEKRLKTYYAERA